MVLLFYNKKLCLKLLYKQKPYQKRIFVSCLFEINYLYISKLIYKIFVNNQYTVQTQNIKNERYSLMQKILNNRIFGIKFVFIIRFI